MIHPKLQITLHVDLDEITATFESLEEFGIVVEFYVPFASQFLVDIHFCVIALVVSFAGQREVIDDLVQL